MHEGTQVPLFALSREDPACMIEERNGAPPSPRLVLHISGDRPAIHFLSTDWCGSSRPKELLRALPTAYMASRRARIGRRVLGHAESPPRRT